MKQLALDIGLPALPTLVDFVAGANEAALAHLRIWTAGDSRSPVPTYLHGPPASGKSHLLRAVQHALAEHGAVCGWMDATVREPAAFDERWAAVLMDDVDRYTPVQQHRAFNWLVNAQSLQRGMLAAGALPPSHLTLREDLRTRLGWGHVHALEPLNEAGTRMVLRRAAEQRGLTLGDEVLDFVLVRFSRDLESLVGLLDRLDTYALETRRAITVPMVRAMLEQS